MIEIIKTPFNCICSFFDNRKQSKFITAIEKYVNYDATGNKPSLKSISKLISKGIDLNRKNKDGLTAAHIAAKHCHLDLLKIFKKANADFNVCTEDGDTLLILACKNMPRSNRNFRETEIIDVLVSHGCDINATDKDGFSALHFAAQWCGKRAVERLIKLGANVHCRTNKLQLTPLHSAAMFGCPGTVKVLAKAGADLNATNVNGVTPLHLATMISIVVFVRQHVSSEVELYDERYTMPIKQFQITVHDRREDVFKMLLSSGTETNFATKSGVSNIARALNRFAFVKALIENGGKIHCRDENDMTASQLLSDEFLNEYETNSCPTTILTIRGHTAPSMHLKTMRLPKIYVKIVQELLLKIGVHMNNSFVSGKSPLYYVSENGMINFVQALQNSESMAKCAKETLQMKNYSTVMSPNFMDVRNHLSRHALKLLAASLIPTEVNRDYILKSQNDLSDYYLKCCDEVVKMKKHLIDYGLSMYDLLHINQNRRFFYADFTMPKDVESMFPIYCKYIRASYHEAFVKKLSLTPALLAWNKMTNINLPDICVERILSYLSNENLRAIVKTANVIDYDRD